jgi:hypothetical protein
MHDPAIVALRGKVRLVPPPPVGSSGARPPLIQITMTDGARLVQDNVGPGVLGLSATNPMSRDQVIAKARELMAPVLGTAQTSRLVELVLALDKVKDIRELRPLLQVADRGGAPRLSEYPNVR